MTHSNHRRGTRESLVGDWVMFTSGGGGTVETSSKLLEIYAKHNPIAMSLGRGRGARWIKHWTPKMNSGTLEVATPEEVKNKPMVVPARSPHGGSAVFDNKEAVEAVLKDLNEADLGFSVVVSGIFDELFPMTKRAGLKNAPHTINMSAETFGRTELLAEPHVLEFTTMCGHDYVSPYLVRYLLERVKNGKLISEAAVVEMAKQCTCNFFNVERARKLINAYVEKG
jgi:hypothetical protein